METYLRLSPHIVGGSKERAYQGWIEVGPWSVQSDILSAFVYGTAVAAGLRMSKLMKVSFDTATIVGVQDERVMHTVQHHSLRVIQIFEEPFGAHITFAIGNSYASHGAVPHENQRPTPIDHINNWIDGLQRK